jgi:hypothetical protein
LTVGDVDDVRLLDLEVTPIGLKCGIDDGKVAAEKIRSHNAD